MKNRNVIVLGTDNLIAKKNISFCFVKDYVVEYVAKGDDLKPLLKNKKCGFAFVELDLLKTLVVENQTLLEVFLGLTKNTPSTEFIILCEPRSVSEAVQIVRSGANSYLIHPIEVDEVRYVVENTLEIQSLKQELDYLRDEFWTQDSLHLVQTKSSEMLSVFSAVRSVARMESTVYIKGETGVGKGVVAQLIHQHSPRSNGAFIHVHCGAIPENLIESELFGHEKGAFTGATNRKLGKFELAKGGTIFLDEIGTMSKAVQIKLLKVLQDKIFQRVGGEETIGTDVRVISASNENLLELVDKGEFRKDLYYRLNVFPIEIPPLRSRLEDVEFISKGILDRLNGIHGKNILGLHPAVIKKMAVYPWPGNIRELENVLERAYILENTSYLTPSNFPNEIIPSNSDEPHVIVNTNGTLAETRKQAIEEVELKYLIEKLSVHKGKINRTAEEAGITPRQLHKLMVKYQLNRKEFK